MLVNIYVVLNFTDDNQFMINIIIIEDDPEYAKIYEIALLEYSGITFEWYMLGHQALKMLSINPPAYDAAIIDIHLPDMPGSRVALEAREMHENLPVLFITGIHDDYNISLLEQQGTYLEKPFRLSDFHNKIFDLVVTAKENKIKFESKSDTWPPLNVIDNTPKQ